jgi:hypothetical protein
VSRLGQGNKVELLITAITKNVQLLVNSEAIRSVTPSQNRELKTILNNVKDLYNSTLQEDRLVLTFHSSGAQNNNINNSNGQLNTGSC